MAENQELETTLGSEAGSEAASGCCQNPGSGCEHGGEPETLEVKLRAEIQQLNDRWLRTEAEMENVRRRARRDMEENAKFANQRLMTDMMDVVDNLHRALLAADSTQAGSVIAGVQMVVMQFEEVLKRHGCERIPTEGQAFDPNIHEAIQMVPSSLPAGSVVQEVRSGYRLYERVIRPAQVIVAAAN